MQVLSAAPGGSDVTLVYEVGQCWEIFGREMNAVRELSRNIAVKHTVNHIMTTQIACFDGTVKSLVVGLFGSGVKAE